MNSCPGSQLTGMESRGAANDPDVAAPTSSYLPLVKFPRIQHGIHFC